MHSTFSVTEHIQALSPFPVLYLQFIFLLFFFKYGIVSCDIVSVWFRNFHLVCISSYQEVSRSRFGFMYLQVLAAPKKSKYIYISIYGLLSF